MDDGTIVDDALGLVLVIFPIPISISILFSFCVLLGAEFSDATLRPEECRFHLRCIFFLRCLETRNFILSLPLLPFVSVGVCCIAILQSARRLSLFPFYLYLGHFMVLRSSRGGGGGGGMWR